MRCMQCGKGKMVERFGPIEADYRDERFTIEFTATVCPKCGFYFIDGEDSTEMMRLLADAYRKKHGLLTSVEIKAFREGRGETQKQFAEYLRVGEASIKRWELGAIQDEAMDELIRLKCDPEKAKCNAEQLARKRVPPFAEYVRSVVPARPTKASFSDPGDLPMHIHSSSETRPQFAYGA